MSYQSEAAVALLQVLLPRDTNIQQVRQRATVDAYHVYLLLDKLLQQALHVLTL